MFNTIYYIKFVLGRNLYEIFFFSKKKTILQEPFGKMNHKGEEHPYLGDC